MITFEKFYSWLQDYTSEGIDKKNYSLLYRQLIGNTVSWTMLQLMLISIKISLPDAYNTSFLILTAINTALFVISGMIDVKAAKKKLLEKYYVA